jgi:hypothetical protein
MRQPSWKWVLAVSLLLFATVAGAGCKEDRVASETAGKEKAAAEKLIPAAEVPEKATAGQPAPVGVKVGEADGRNDDKGIAAPAKDENAIAEAHKGSKLGASGGRGRPSFMPCKIVAANRFDGRPSIKRVYNLKYGGDGRLLGASSERNLGKVGGCPTLDSDSCVFVPESADVSYRYNEEMGLIEVRQSGEDGPTILRLKYAANGQLETSQWEEPLMNGKKNTMRTTFKWKDDGDVMSSGKGRIFFKSSVNTEEATAYISGGGDGPLKGKVIVWPFNLRRVFLGQKTSATVSETSGLGTANSMWGVEFDSTGAVERIDQTDNGDHAAVFSFIYSCP